MKFRDYNVKLLSRKDRDKAIEILKEMELELNKLENTILGPVEKEEIRARILGLEMLIVEMEIRSVGRVSTRAVVKTILAVVLTVAVFHVTALEIMSIGFSNGSLS